MKEFGHIAALSGRGGHKPMSEGDDRVTREDQIRDLLRRYRVDQDEYLHDGRRVTTPPLDSYVDKIVALFAPRAAAPSSAVPSSHETHRAEDA